ncbi:MAG: CapA family protein [Trueperella sp.]|nr:CapA family protein [Trueperella sp.]
MKKSHYASYLIAATVVAVLFTVLAIFVGMHRDAKQPEAASKVPAAEVAPTPEPEPITITIAATGDTLPHTPVNRSALAYGGGTSYDYAPMFVDIAPVLQEADLAICRLETPLTKTNTNLSRPDLLIFNTPHELTAGLKSAGYDACDFACNHTMDQGMAGLAATEEIVRAAGLGYAGPSANPDRAGKAEFLTAGNAKVAHLAYTYTFPNDWGPNTKLPPDAPWLAANSWPIQGSQGIIEQAEEAKEAGADFVVVSLHWGVEYQREPTAEQRQLAKELLESPAVDLILGAHAHVVQPCEQINGKHVIYGMGNSLSNQSPRVLSTLAPDTQDGMIAIFTLTKDPAGTVTTQMRYQPTFVELAGHVVRRVSPSTNAPSWQRTVQAVESLGGCSATAVHP